MVIRWLYLSNNIINNTVVFLITPHTPDSREIIHVKVAMVYLNASAGGSTRYHFWGCADLNVVQLQFTDSFRVYVTCLKSWRIVIKDNPCTSFPGERGRITLGRFGLVTEDADGSLPFPHSFGGRRRECVSALALLPHLHRLELKSSERRRQFEEAADGSRTELVWGNREKSDDGRKQDWTELPGWSWIHRQTGPEVSESSSREGESEEPFTLAQFILGTVQTCVSRPWGISRVEVPAQTLLMSAVKQQSSCCSWTMCGDQVCLAQCSF